MSTGRAILVFAGSIAAVVACVGDLVVPFLLGRHYPGYSHLRHVVSLLGSADSPVARWMNLWWIAFGCLMLLFALAFGLAQPERTPAAVVLAVQLAMLGALAGIGPGLFPMDVGQEVTLSGRLHNALGGAGFLAIAVAPAVSMVLFRPGEHTAMFAMAVGTQAAVLVAVALLTLSGPRASGALRFTGLWQRLFLLSCYVFVSALAIHTARSVRGGS